MDNVENIRLELNKFSDPEKARFLPKLFKAIPGGYGEGDQFIGVNVPFQRRIAKEYYKGMSLEVVQYLLRDSIYEYR